jgi:hypothetical protein
MKTNMQDGAPELVLVWKAWLFFAFAIANILGNSKLAAGKNQHAGRKLAADIPGNNVHIIFFGACQVLIITCMHICLPGVLIHGDHCFQKSLQ